MKKNILLQSIIATVVCCLVVTSQAFALTADEKSYLSLYFSDEELTVESATRSAQPISHVADNMTVVTAADIKRMNAHSLADVLNTIPGVEIWSSLAPGAGAAISILGSDNPHVTVLMDGVPRNWLASQFADPGMIPVQDIEKIEVIKGAASSAWGSALGGVINIITKSGKQLDQGAVLSGSYGNKNFADLRGEMRGKENGLGYYLSVGRLQAGALSPNTSVAENNVYSKFSYDLSNKTEIQAVMAYERTDRDDGGYTFANPPAELDSSIADHLHWTLGINTSLSSNLDLSISAWSFSQSGANKYLQLEPVFLFDVPKLQDRGDGLRAKLTWKIENQTVVVGADADSKTEKYWLIAGGSQTIRDQAVYVNDTIVVNGLTIIPGIRYDTTNLYGGFTSPSLGATYAVAKGTLLRAFVARGFNIPSAADTSGGLGWIGNPNLEMETAWSYQAGIETAVWKPVWMKLTLFRSDLRDQINWVDIGGGVMQVQNIGHSQRDGVLIEARTAPVYNTSLSVGAEFISATYQDTDLVSVAPHFAGQHLPAIPTQVYDVALRYDDKQTFNAVLQGRHINWNTMNYSVSKYDSMLIDLTANKKVYERRNAGVEVFASAHNLLNTQQYPTDTHPNAPRWYEAGLRCKF